MIELLSEVFMFLVHPFIHFLPPAPLPLGPQNAINCFIVLFAYLFLYKLCLILKYLFDFLNITATILGVGVKSGVCNMVSVLKEFMLE